MFASERMVLLVSSTDRTTDCSPNFHPQIAMETKTRCFLHDHCSVFIKPQMDCDISPTCRVCHPDSVFRRFSQVSSWCRPYQVCNSLRMVGNRHCPKLILDRLVFFFVLRILSLARVLGSLLVCVLSILRSLARVVWRLLVCVLSILRWSLAGVLRRLFVLSIPLTLAIVLRNILLVIVLTLVILRHVNHSSPRSFRRYNSLSQTNGKRRSCDNENGIPIANDGFSPAHRNPALGQYIDAALDCIPAFHPARPPAHHLA